MTDMSVLGLTLVSLALFISVCLNFILCIRQRGSWCRDKQRCCHHDNSEEDTLSQVERQYVCDISHRGEQENPHNHHERQENPIYGNISTEWHDSSEGCYEMMSLQRNRDCIKPLEPDLNYASLNLKLAKKRKKRRHLQGQAQNRHQQDQLDVSAPSGNTFFEVDAEVEALLPPRDNSTMVSHSSIYLNSQQIALEAQEMEQERSVSKLTESAGRDGLQEGDGGGRRDWNEGGEREERKDNPDDGNACVQRLEVETAHSATDPFTDSFSGDGD
ncbi:uncharacterized protein LOC106514030 [Austrofundulus limnaeus]|uniref:Uncharacterized protein LOC106514030 n=1 Tax=Austrofundulus limnaeus TaxID=52670 RepID=A0A2I4ASU4_AUSLI|nr:PREDICTED: uncharacterized protein LOC106514030 [Austrofundulus limnaeus]